MKLNTRQCWLMAGLAMGVLGSSAVAQVAPPPTQPVKEEAEYVPPVKQAAPTANPAQAAQPTKVQSTQSKRNAGQEGLSKASLPTSTPYPKLATKGKDGKIKRLTELPDILAFTSNPTIGPKSVEAMMPVLYGRRARFERIIVDNLDLYWLVTDGRIETMNLNDIQNMAEIAEMIKPLVGRTTLSQELLNRGILTRTQGGMNEYIVNEYKQAVTAEIQFETEDPLSEVMRFVLKDSIHEPSLAYKAMVAEASIKIGDIVKKAGLTSSSATAVAKLQRPLNKDAATQKAQLAEFENAFRNLSVDEAMAVFTTMRNSRKNPDISPAIKPLNVMHDRKVDISDSDAMQGTIEYRDGKTIDTRKTSAAHNAKMKEQNEQFEKKKQGKSSNPDD